MTDKELQEAIEKTSEALFESKKKDLPDEQEEFWNEVKIFGKLVNEASEYSSEDEDEKYREAQWEAWRQKNA